MDVSDHILRNINKGNVTGAVVLDLSKAFDLINHPKLKTKLAKFGIRWPALDCSANYLQDRSQVVWLIVSDRLDPSLSVPQGFCSRTSSIYFIC